MTDMGTFMCPSQCSDLCKVTNLERSCELNDFWKPRLSAKTDPFKAVEGDDRKKLIGALGRLPKIFQPRTLKALVKGTRSVDFSAPTSPATSSDEYIILFPSAFSESNDLSRIVMHETVHFLAKNELGPLFSKYKKQFGWKSEGATEIPRSDGFVQPDGRLSADEDFANNIEYFIFDSPTLKLTSPKIFNWIQKNLGDKIKLGKGCHANR